MSDAVESVLRKTPLFASLTGEETQALRRRVSSKHYDRGELLFSEGDACGGLFIVGKGKIRIFKLSPSGRDQRLPWRDLEVRLRNCRFSTVEIIRLRLQPRKTRKCCLSRGRISRISAESIRKLG